MRNASPPSVCSPAAANSLTRSRASPADPLLSARRRVAASWVFTVTGRPAASAERRSRMESQPSPSSFPSKPTSCLLSTRGSPCSEDRTFSTRANCSPGMPSARARMPSSPASTEIFASSGSFSRAWRIRLCNSSGDSRSQDFARASASCAGIPIFCSKTWSRRCSFRSSSAA